MTNISTIASGRGPYAQTHLILGASAATGMSVTGTSSETALATITVPAGSMGLNGIIRVTPLFSYTNSANNKTLRVRLGGISGPAFLANTATTSLLAQPIVMIRNRGVANSQVGFTAATFSSIATTTGSLATGSVDTSAATTLVISGELANTGETITLESYIVELIRTD